MSSNLNTPSIQGMLRQMLERDALIVTNAGAPVDGTSGTYAGIAGPGSILLDTTNGQAYVNTNTLASPTWSKLADSLGDIGLADGKVLIGNASGLAAAQTLSGDISNDRDGVVTIGAQSVERTMLGIAVINKSGVEIGIDKIVQVTGIDTGTGIPRIVLADATSGPPKVTNLYVTSAAIANDAQGVVTKQKLSVADLDTDSFSAAGDDVYLTSAGGFTTTVPAASAAGIIVGSVVTKHATTGQILWLISDSPIYYGENQFNNGAVALSKLHNNVLGEVDSLAMKRVARATYDFGVSGGGQGAIDLGVTLPDNAIVVGGFVDVVTTLTSAGDTATGAIHVEGADDIVAAVAINDGSNPWDIGLHAIVPKANTPESTGIKLTAARAITFTIGTQDVTAGKFVVFLDYVISV